MKDNQPSNSCRNCDNEPLSEQATNSTDSLQRSHREDGKIHQEAVEHNEAEEAGPGHGEDGHRHQDGEDCHDHSSHAHSHGGHDHGGHGHSHDDGHDHGGHGHSHDHGAASRYQIPLLIVAAIAYVIAFIVDSYTDNRAVVIIYAVAILLSGYSTFLRGLRNLIRLRFDIDTLMTIALTGAIGIGDWKEATLVALLFGLNEWLEGFGFNQAKRSLESLMKTAPDQAVKVVDGKETVVKVAELAPGDLVLVKPGEKIPSDGNVESGRSSVNEAAITGESLPADKSPGSPVYGGSIVNEGVLRIKIEKPYADSSLATILKLVQDAQSSRTPTELFINRFSRYYTPIILVIAALTLLIPPLLLGHTWMAALYQALSVLIIGCPCALILSSPVAIAAGISRSARSGILIKGGAFLELLGKMDTLAFDKTGTLTRGEPAVQQSVVFDQDRFYAVAGAIERTSSHPLARAVLKEIEGKTQETGSADETEVVAGMGVKAQVSGKTYWLGNERSLDRFPVPADVTESLTQFKEQGLTLVILSDEKSVLGIFGIADRIRDESAAVIGQLKRAGMKHIVMLTGDHNRTAEQVAQSVGITEYKAELLPEGKVDVIKKLAKEGIVGMVGDGVNDAPALASAQLGIAMGKGTDSAIETADIVLMQDHLAKLPVAIRTARRVNHLIRMNISIAIGLKVIALLLTIPGWLTLWIAILSDMGATVIVTLTSLTILIGRDKE